MNFNHPDRSNSTAIVRVVCTIAFVAYTFLWLYYFQADVIAAAHHVLNGGARRYNPIVGAVIVTGVLWALQVAVAAAVRLKRHLYALTYVPSMLVLAFISDVNIDANGNLHLGAWLWIAVAVLAVWGGAVAVARAAEPYMANDNASSGLFSRHVWVNLMVLAFEIMGVAALGNTNIVFHYRMKMESAMKEGDYERALAVGEKSDESDGNLLMLRMYALSREKLLGEKLFQYPITGTAADVLPTGGKTRFVMYPVNSLYKHLGARPVAAMEPMDYLQLLRAKNKASDAVPDYILCTLLIERRLDDFAIQIAKYYDINESLPKFYKEALTLYTHLRSNPVVTYRDPVCEEDFEDFRELERQYTDPSERRGKIADKYRYSYWYYHEYSD